MTSMILSEVDMPTNVDQFMSQTTLA